MEREESATIAIVFVTLFIFTAADVFAREGSSSSSDLPVKWGELTAPDFAEAAKKSGGVCLVPIGVFEKHGPHLPLGTDLIDVREIALRAAGREYALVFPEYYFSQILEAKHQPGTIAYSPKLIETKTGGHAGEAETSMMQVLRTDLVHMDRAKEQSGKDLAPLEHIPANYTGMFWYAQYPNHYAGDGSYAKPELGELLINSQAEQLAELINILKTDDTILDLQSRFYKEPKTRSRQSSNMCC